MNVYEEGAGAEAGFQAGDILYKIDGEDVTGQDLNNVVAKIKGEEGTQVEITVLRGENMEEYTATATRKVVEVHTVEHEMKSDGIGYIRITEFDSVTYDQFASALEDLEAQGMTGLVIDLRDNPGGNLDTWTSRRFGIYSSGRNSWPMLPPKTGGLHKFGLKTVHLQNHGRALRSSCPPGCLR